MSEASAWATLRGHLKGPGVHIQRIEDSMSAGIPDCYVMHKGKGVWIEGKFLKALPKLPPTPLRIGLRPEQATWLENEHAAGGRAGVWIRVLDDGWWWCEGMMIRELVSGLCRDDMMSCFTHCGSAKELASEILR